MIIILGKAFKTVVKSWNNEKVRYVGFDLHAICKNSNFEKLSLLMDKVDKELKEFGYFVTDGKKVVRSQQGVFRTNCKGKGFL
jgi:hypothetical protein